MGAKVKKISIGQKNTRRVQKLGAQQTKALTNL